LLREGENRAKAAARAVSADRMLIETDAPVAAWSSLPQILDAAAALRGGSPAELARITRENARHFFTQS
jgi:Tat protein secretion system quality control protein TatD with DNase activity